MTRGARLAELVAEHELDQLFVSDLTNVRYLTGFTGTNGACLVGRSELVFFTDFRYTERAKEEVASEWERPEAERELIPQIVARMSGRVGFEDAKLSVRQLARLEAAAGEDVEFLPAGDLVEQLRAVKEPDELERDRRGGGAHRRRLPMGARARPRRPHRARRRSRLPRRASASSAPSPPSRRSSRRGPMAPSRTPSPGEREIGTGRARRLRHGRPARRLLLGLHPHLRHRRSRRRGPRGLRARPAGPGRRARGGARRGPTGKEVDAVAREMISEAGHGDHFGHGLGHGVGLEVHEGPAPGGHLRRRARGGQRRHRRARRLPARAASASGSRTWSWSTGDGYRNLSGLPEGPRIVD